MYGGKGRSARKGPKAGVNGVSGVPGVEMYRPPHFGQRIGSSEVEAEAGRKPFVLPARRG